MLGIEDMKPVEVGVAAGAGLALSLLAYKRHTTPPKVEEEKYQGAESYADPPKIMTGLKEDLKNMSLKDMMNNLQTLLDVAKNKHYQLPDDDKKLLVSSEHPATAHATLSSLMMH